MQHVQLVYSNSICYTASLFAVLQLRLLHSKSVSCTGIAAAVLQIDFLYSIGAAA